MEVASRSGVPEVVNSECRSEPSFFFNVIAKLSRMPDREVEI